MSEGKTARRTAVGLWADIESALAAGGHVLLWGPPGTGKTFAARRFGLAGRESVGLTVTADTSAAELRGSWVPGQGVDGQGCVDCDRLRHLSYGAGDAEGQALALAEGLRHLARHTAEVAAGWRFHRGPASRAFSEGWRLALDELGELSGDGLIFGQGLLDDKAVAGLTLPSGERLARHPAFQCVGTTNTHPRRLPSALVDRMLCVEVDLPAPGAVLALPAPVRDAAWSLASAREVDGRVSVRTFGRFVHLVDGGMSVARAARLAFGDGRYRDILDGLEVAGTLSMWANLEGWRGVEERERATDEEAAARAWSD